MSRFGDFRLRNTGATTRIHYLAENLAALGHEVHVIIPGIERSTTRINGIVIHEVDAILAYNMRFLRVLFDTDRSESLCFYDPFFVLRAFYIFSTFDAIQIEGAVEGSLITILAKILRKPIVIDSHDAFQTLRIGRSGFFKRNLEVFAERVSYRFAKLVITVSIKEKEILIKYGVNRDKIEVVPNGVDVRLFAQPNHSFRNRDLKGFYKIVFVGNMEYAPNLEAAKLIVSRIAPKVMSRIKNVKFSIIGRLPTNMHAVKNESRNIMFTGPIKDLAGYLMDSDVAIAPLMHGSGTRLKILEYFSCSLPVVSTSVGVEGLDVTNNENVLIEDNIDNFALRIIDLLGDKKLSQKLGKSARGLVTKEYDWKMIAGHLEEIYHSRLAQRDSS